MPPSLPETTSSRALTVAVWAFVALVCGVAVGAILVLPDSSKAVGLVYGGF